MVKRPFDMLNQSVGKRVVVGLKGGKEIEGKMVAFDVHMNIVLEEVKVDEKEYKSIFVRGDSVVFVLPIE